MHVPSVSPRVRNFRLDLCPAHRTLPLSSTQRCRHVAATETSGVGGFPGPWICSLVSGDVPGPAISQVRFRLQSGPDPGFRPQSDSLQLPLPMKVVDCPHDKKENWWVAAKIFLGFLVLLYAPLSVLEPQREI